MTANNVLHNRAVVSPNSRKRSNCVLTTFAWIALSPLLTSCVGTVSSIVPKAPAQQDAWLSFKFQSPNGLPGCGNYSTCTELVNNAEATAYYNALGIANPSTYKFSDWLTLAGFTGANSNQIAHAIYANKLDLQFGRDMYCVQKGQTIACYVVNYGPAPFVNGAENPLWPDLSQALDDAHNHTHPPFATVAMIYDPANTNNTVSFYVFANGAASDPFDPTTVPLVLQAALDAEGGKTVPRMCMSCHGGAYTKSTSNSAAQVHGAAFLPFDVFSFGLAANDQGQLDFLNLNAFVLATNPPPAIAEFINGTYADYTAGGLGAPFSKTQVGTVVDFIPKTGWHDATDPSDPNIKPAAIYGSVVRQYCRMCHLAQSQDFSTYTKFRNSAALIEDYACSIGDMPHMEVPFGSQTNKLLQNGGVGFWLDPDPQARLDLHNFLSSVLQQTSTCATN
jgi:hypothetical protein